MTKHEAICTLSLMATELVGELAGTDSDESNAKLLKRYIDSVNMAISALRQQDVADKDVGKNEPLTNAQKIRSMTDDELAWELMLWRCEAVARHHGISSEYPDTQKTILEWLQQPAGAEDKHE